MKRTCIIFFTILLLSCAQNSKMAGDEDDNIKPHSEKEIAHNFDWMTGKWKRVNEKAGKQTFEHWERLSATEYLGFGFTLQNGDTVSQEIMQIRVLNGKWIFSAQLPDDSAATVFAVTEQAAGEFVCVNGLNDFPKKIRYWFESGKMKAMISNEKMDISFVFERIK